MRNHDVWGSGWTYLRLVWRLALLVFAPAFAPAQTPLNQPLVFRGATIIDVQAGQPRRGMTIVVTGQRIAAVGRANEIGLPAGSRIIDVRGQYVIPGLLDMHVHLGPWEMPLLVANGVTGIREMGSECHPAWSGRDCLADLLAWRRQLESGELISPRLLALSSWAVMARSRWPTKGPRGPAETLPEFFAAGNAEQGRQLARYFSQRKIEFIKVSGHLPREGFLGLVEEARKLGLPVAGHEQLATSAMEASEAGMSSFEHARVFLFGCFAGAEEFARLHLSEPDTNWRRRMVNEFDANLCQGIFKTFARNGTRYVPTHLTRRMEAFADDPAFRQDWRSKYIPKARWKAWNQDADSMIRFDPSKEGRLAMKDFYKKGLDITGLAHRSGVTVMLGTDSADSYVFPGFAVHDELEELVKAGLTPADALKAATWNGAAYLGRTSELGSIEQGKLADLVFLHANPLTDIRNTRGIAAVVLNGRYLDRSALQKLLREAEMTAQR